MSNVVWLLDVKAFRLVRQASPLVGEEVVQRTLLSWLGMQKGLKTSRDGHGNWWVDTVTLTSTSPVSQQGRTEQSLGSEDTVEATGAGQDELSEVDEGADRCVPHEEAEPLETEQLVSAPGVLAVAKPAGYTTEDVIKVVSERISTGETGLSSVSRLDVMTSGVLVIAKGGLQSAAFESLKEQFAERKVIKEYLCLCGGPPFGPAGFKGEVTTKLKMGKAQYRAFVSPHGKEAHTTFEVVAAYHHAPVPCDELATPLSRLVAVGHVYTLLRVSPLTGRTHQIRAHLQSIGRPLVSDTKYGTLGRRELEWCPRMFLHCARMEVLDLEGRLCRAEASLPAELETALAHLTLI